MITISAFKSVPEFARGLVRDLRVRWALEEAGLPYRANLIGRDDLASAGYRAQQPFGQVPAFEEDGFSMFESGAIVLHIAERSDALMPSEPTARARTKTWMFAALNTVEPPILFLNQIDMQKGGADPAQREAVAARVKMRLASLSERLEGRDYLEERFTASDLLMTSVLRILRRTDMVAQMPVLEAYRLRCEARPAFQKALADQMANFAANAPPA